MYQVVGFAAESALVLIRLCYIKHSIGHVHTVKNLKYAKALRPVTMRIRAMHIMWSRIALTYK